MMVRLTAAVAAIVLLLCALLSDASAQDPKARLGMQRRSSKGAITSHRLGASDTVGSGDGLPVVMVEDAPAPVIAHGHSQGQRVPHRISKLLSSSRHRRSSASASSAPSSQQKAKQDTWSVSRPQGEVLGQPGYGYVNKVEACGKQADPKW